MMNKFEVFTMIAYWVGCVIWLYGAWKYRQAKKRLDAAIELLAQTQHNIIQEKPSHG